VGCCFLIEHIVDLNFLKTFRIFVFSGATTVHRYSIVSVVQKELVVLNILARKSNSCLMEAIMELNNTILFCFGRIFFIGISL
jgi:hypothetical protein